MTTNQPPTVIRCDREPCACKPNDIAVAWAKTLPLPEGADDEELQEAA